MQLDCQTLVLLAIFAAALIFPWQPAEFFVRRFLTNVQRQAGVDKANLDERRKEQKQRRRVLKSERIADNDVFDVPNWIPGVFERYLALVLVLVFGVTTPVVTILIAWIGAKLWANWQRQSGSGANLQDQIIRAHTFIALMAGTLSVGLGVFSGLVARLALCLICASKPVSATLF